ncbi:VanZ family protein [Congregibacter sp.]|uniref:VanZ family protein n=1 Tax=Congregibacter sp. TaxID=2744308 RepID=UPI00386A76BE
MNSGGSAVAEARLLSEFRYHQRLLRWLGVMLFIVSAWTLSTLIPSYLALAPAQTLSGQSLAWSLSQSITADLDQDKLQWAAERPGPHWASRALSFPAEAEFVRVEFCLNNDVPAETAAVLLASVRDGRLDFNRQYRMNSFYSGVAGECFNEPIPRRRGDGPAIFQIQLINGPAALSLNSLDVTPLEENPVWRITRMGMLTLGIVLIVLVLKDYLAVRPRILVFAGLMTVLGILFGCCVSVSLKADIYELLTGGRSIDARHSMQALLQTQFPLGGFSLFTFMHAVLFCGATFFLGLARRYAWLDMLMLAPATETLQLFVPGRGPGTRDMLVDWFGVAVAVLLVFLLRRSQRVRAFLEDQGVNENTTGLG